MSAPNTDPEKQVQRHKPALLGMGTVVGLVAVLLVGFIFIVFSRGSAPEGADVQIDGRTGEAVEVSN